MAGRSPQILSHDFKARARTRARSVTSRRDGAQRRRRDVPQLKSMGVGRISAAASDAWFHGIIELVTKLCYRPDLSLGRLDVETSRLLDLNVFVESSIRRRLMSRTLLLLLTCPYLESKPVLLQIAREPSWFLPPVRLVAVPVGLLTHSVRLAVGSIDETPGWTGKKHLPPSHSRCPNSRKAYLDADGCGDSIMVDGGDGCRGGGASPAGAAFQ